MKKILLILLSCIIIFAAMPFCVQATEDIEAYIEAYDGIAYHKGVIHLLATEFVDHSDYVGEGPFDFFGVPIVKFECPGGPEQMGQQMELYWVTVSPEVDTREALEIISNAEGVFMASMMKVTTNPWDGYTAADFSGMTAEERLALGAFVPDEITVCLDYELDLTAFENEAKNYLFGVSVAEINRAEVADGYVYNVKFGDQEMENHLAVQVLEANENVLWTDYESTYGNGDINDDGKADSSDYLLAKRICFNSYTTSDYEAGYADVNNDGTVDSADYVLLKRACF